MAKPLNRDGGNVEELVASLYPVARESLRTAELEDAQHQIAAAIMATSRPANPVRRRRWLRTPRHVILAGAVVAGLGGSIAAAASFLSAHTGKYPSKMGIPLAMSGPGEALNSAAPDFCRVALHVSSDIPFPARYASWRDYVLRLDFGIRRPSPSIPCSSPTGGQVTTGWLGQWFATTALCGWAQAWAQDVGAGNRAGAARDARVILHATDWRAVRWVDPHPDDTPAGDAPGGTRTKTTFGWILFYQQAVRSGDRVRMESLLDGHVGYGDRSVGFDECQSGPDPDIVGFLQRYPRLPWPAAQRLLLRHLRSEGI